MNLKQIGINDEIERVAIYRFLLKEKEYINIAKHEVLKNLPNDIEYLAIEIIEQYILEISMIKRYIKDKIIVETLYPDEVKKVSLQRFPPYI